jgi:tight adherence protein B
MEFLTAALVFVAIVGCSVGLWWQGARKRALRDRLRPPDKADAASSGILRTAVGSGEGWPASLATFSVFETLATLIQQSGQTIRPRTVFATMAALGVVAALLGGLRTGSLLIGLLCAAFAACGPIVFLVFKRGQRLSRFERQLPDSLDMMTRATRAGHALTASMQLVAEEAGEPLGSELGWVVEETRLGSDINDALDKLCRRIPLRDVQFFATVIKIQRTSGGNLAEMLERLADVVRDRFKLLSQAQAIAMQQKWSAILIGISPVAFAVLFRLMNPRYFDPLFASPLGPTLITAGILSEVVGFAVIWRMSKLKV